MEFKRRNRSISEFSMASMTDIIFLLLIFFMITSSAINQSTLEVQLPEASSANSHSSKVSVSISKDGHFFLNDRSLDKNALESALKQALSKEKKPYFILRADAQCLHREVVFVMNIASKNRYHIAFATLNNQ